MNGSYLLDTNIVIALFEKDQHVINSIKDAQSIFIPSIILLDILIISDELLALLRPGPPILRGVRGVGEEVPKAFCPVACPSIVIGELYYGAYNSSRLEENVSRVEAFHVSASVLPCDEFTAKFYGQIKTSLKKKGNPIPENDLWICALGLQHKYIIVSRDKNFQFVDNLDLAIW